MTRALINLARLPVLALMYPLVAVGAVVMACGIICFETDQWLKERRDRNVRRSKIKNAWS